MNILANEMWFALRGLRAQFRFVVFGLFVVVLGTSAASALVGIVDALLWVPLPVSEPHTLTFVYRNADGLLLGVNYEEASAIRRSGVFDVSAVRSADKARARVAQSTWYWSGDSVSWDYFDLMGHRPIVGRTFMPEDDAPGAEPVVIISSAIWRGRFNADPGILGSSVTLEPAARGVHAERGRAYVIVGVMGPQSERLASPWQSTQYWVPVLSRQLDYACDIDVLRYGLFNVIGRLKGGLSTIQATAALAPINAEFSKSNPDRTSLVIRSSRSVRLPFGSPLLSADRLALVSLVLAGMLVLVAAVNLSGLLMARIVSRRTANAIRHALGAGPAVLAVQVATESIVLAVGGCLLSWAAAVALIRISLSYMPIRLGAEGADAWSLEILSYRMLVIVGCVNLCTCLVAGLTAALAGTREKGLGILGGSGLPSDCAPLRIRYWLVVPQIAFSVAIVLVAGALGVSVLRTETTDPGYQVDGLLYAKMDMLWPSRCRQTADTPERMRITRDTAVQRALMTARTLPGAHLVSLASSTPFSPSTTWIVPRVGEPVDASGLRVYQNAVSHDFFATMRIELLDGRVFDSRDTRHSTPVVVVSESLGRRLWPSGQALGRQLAYADHRGNGGPIVWREVVGVVRDVRPPLSDGDVAHWLYLPLGQGAAESFVLVRSMAPAPELADRLSAAIRNTDEQVEVVAAGTARAAIAIQRYSRRAAAVVLSGSALLSAFLALLGLYSLIAYSVTRRFPEFGLRMALGATKRQIVILVLTNGLRMFVVGGLLGICLGIIGLQVISRTVVAMPPLQDALIGSSLLCLLAGAAVVAACYLPAQRAAAVDPVISLRHL